MNHGTADLHIHTVASDGTSTLEERIEQARDRELDTIAITDHDRIATSLAGRVEHRDEVSVISGVEIRADIFETKVEILGYYVSSQDRQLRSALDRARSYRRERNRRLIEKIDQLAGIDLSYETVQSEVDGNLGRPHIAERLVDAGVVDSVGSAFEEYLAEGGAAFVPMNRLSHERVIDVIHEAGGVASLAHPGRIRSDRVSEMVDRLTKAGLDGIEVWYPYRTDRSSAYADIGVEEALALADEHNLIPTGGSDCHGPGSGKFRIGDVRVPLDALNRLQERAHP